MTKILLVEDDQNFGDVLSSYLEMNEFDVSLAVDGEAGLEMFNSSNFDLCVFDVMMPKMDGFSLAREVRKRDGEVPIVFLTAKAMKEDILEGFKLGADDYITKPFNSEELLYRIHAIMKRFGKDDITNQKEFTIGDFNFNYPLRTLTINGEKTKLSPKEAELLKLFCVNKNEVVPRTKALKEIWGEDSYFTARSMDVFVTKLRKYLKKDENIEIVNIHGNGFQLLTKE